MPVKARTPLEEYLKLPEGYPAELIKGEIVVSPSPDVKHQMIEIKLIKDFLKYESKGVVFAEIDIHFDKENVLRPDVIFIRNENKKIIGEKWIEGAPDIVVEIVSPTSSGKDFIEKKEIYEKFGVKEYWIVVPDEEKVYVLLHDGERYKLSCSGKKCKSKVLDGFEWGFDGK